MFDRLIESRRHFADRPLARGGTVSVLLHAGVCAVAVLATLRPHRVDGAAGPPIVISWPQPAEDPSPRDGFDGIPGPTEPPWDVPALSPIGLPPIDDRPPFDLRVLLRGDGGEPRVGGARSEEHTSELQSQSNLVCRLLLEKKKKNIYYYIQLHKTKTKKKKTN